MIEKYCPRLTREDGFDVPGHHAIEHGVEQHEADGGGQVVAVFLQRAGQQVGPLDAHTLLLKQGKVFTTEPKSHGGEKTLGKKDQMVIRQRPINRTQGRYVQS